MRFICIFSIFICSLYSTALPKVGIVVDAYGAASSYAQAMRERGIEPLHIQSQKKLLPVFQKSFDQSLYLNNLAYNGKLQSLVKSLTKYDVQFIIPGVEPGVELADLLSERLKLRTNGTTFSEARRNKFLMAKALKDAGLPTPSFCKVTSIEELLNWQKTNHIEYPIVLKPLNSGGTDGVYICRDPAALKQAFNKLIDKKNALGFINTEILVQSFLRGTEYVINSVSLDGTNKVVAILKSEKTQIAEQGFIYNREVMLAGNTKDELALLKMHTEVLRALGIKNGPAHAEYMLTDKGPVLIEVAARISGGVHPKSNTKSVGFNQIDLTLDAYLHPELFFHAATLPYQRLEHFNQVLLFASEPGCIKNSEEFIKAVSALPSYSDVRLKVSTNQRVLRTVDLITTLGNVYLTHPSEQQIEADYREVNRLSKRWLCK